MTASPFFDIQPELRLSLTGRCPLCCAYCHPLGLFSEWEISRQEVVVLLTAAHRVGIGRLRLTGGEPLIRQDLEEIIGDIQRADFFPEIPLTTNGLGLAKRWEALLGAGLSRVNISLDTLDRRLYARLTGRDLFRDALAGLETAMEAGRAKWNVVALPGINEAEWPSLIAYARDRQWPLRFIEPYAVTGAAAPGIRPNWLERMEALLERTRGPLEKLPAPPDQPERLYQPGDGGPAVGLIPAASAPPCGYCRRLRVTAEGRLKRCLFESGGEALRPLLATGDGAGLEAALERALTLKTGAPQWEVAQAEACSGG